MNKKNLLKGCINAYNGKGNIKPCLKNNQKEERYISYIRREL
jgi:hypothetical protein